ncbi:MAG: type II toxin-antitoxin system VapC family toxin [Bacteroidota bacterium]
MSGTDVLIDTNICIYLLAGDTTVSELLQDQSIAISVITEMELYAFNDQNPASLRILDTFIESVSIVNIEQKVKFNTIKIRRDSKLKLPDAIIAASALSYNLPFISADAGFKRVSALDLFLYQVNQ